MRNVTLTENASETIRCVRVIAIFFMMYVHAWPGATEVLAQFGDGPFGYIARLLISTLGRGSVPMLSIISGFLAVRTLFGGRKPGAFVHKKVNTLLVPMILWSAIALMFFLVEAAYLGEAGFWDYSALDWANSILSLTAPPINTPLAFLRDVFVCAMLAIPLVWLFEKSIGIGYVALLAAIILVHIDPFHVILRPQILLFFGLGVVVAIQGWGNIIPSWGTVILLVIVDGLVSATMDSSSDILLGAKHILHRFTVSILVWKLASLIVARQGYLFRLLVKIEPAIFLIFCSHIIVLGSVSVIVRQFVPGPGHMLYPVYFLVQPIAVVAVGLFVHRLGQNKSKGVIAVLLR